MKKALVVFALLAAAGAAAAQSADDAPEARRMRGDLFAERDSNKDGKISLAEWQQADQARQKQLFERLDADRDGSLTHKRSASSASNAGSRCRSAAASVTKA